jgi:hypothetical protein
LEPRREVRGGILPDTAQRDPVALPMERDVRTPFWRTFRGLVEWIITYKECLLLLTSFESRKLPRDVPQDRYRKGAFDDASARQGHGVALSGVRQNATSNFTARFQAVTLLLPFLGRLRHIRPRTALQQQALWLKRRSEHCAEPFTAASRNTCARRHTRLQRLATNRSLHGACDFCGVNKLTRVPPASSSGGTRLCDGGTSAAGRAGPR